MKTYRDSIKSMSLAHCRGHGCCASVAQRSFHIVFGPLAQSAQSVTNSVLYLILCVYIHKHHYHYDLIGGGRRGRGLELVG